MNRDTIVLARSGTEADLGGYPSREWIVVTPRNIRVRARGCTTHRVIAVDLTGMEVEVMLDHPAVRPAWKPHGQPEIVYVPAFGADE